MYLKGLQGLSQSSFLIGILNGIVTLHQFKSALSVITVTDIVHKILKRRVQAILI